MPESLAERNGGEQRAAHPDADPPARPDDSFAQLRAIIVGPEQRRLLALQEYVRDPAVQTRDVSRVLPDAFQLRAHDPQLMRALAPSVESAITASVQRDPQPLADALFPVIGPAIRKAVAHTFDAMIESLNQALERSVSWRALQWRWTAWRTGKPFAEIVLLHTLEYRVEQVFLIHRETGLLLQHVAVDRRTGQDADQISAMLTAITDFARDSFKVGHSESLESLRVGELAVSIIGGPHAILAAVVRGAIPPAVRTQLENTLESVHRQFAPSLQAYTGDSSAFAPVRPMLEACLVTQRRADAPRPSYRRWVVAAAVLLLLLGTWAYFAVRERQRWNAYLDRLSAEPGLVVLASGLRGGKYFVEGLRDPLARNPSSLLIAGLTAESIDARWEPYQALNPAFVASRAALLLRPPTGVSLTFSDGLLTARGQAPAQWVTDAERLAPAIGGVQRFAFEGATLEATLTAHIEATTIGFDKGQSTIDPAQQASLNSVVGWLEQLDAVLAASGRRAQLEVIGRADSDGPNPLNVQLSEARADHVVDALRNASLTRIELVSRGLGGAPLVPGATEAEHARERRVSFRVHVTDVATQRSSRP